MKDVPIEGEEAVELIELLALLRGMKLEEETSQSTIDGSREAATPLDGLVAELKNNRVLRRKLTSKHVVRAKKPAVHWKKAKRLRRERYQDVLKPQRNAKKASSLTTPEGWWKEASLNWRKNAMKGRESSIPPTITEEEFTEVIYPCFAEKGRVPIFKRLDTSKGVSLENLHVIDMDTEETLFDGSEYSLRLKGYII
ncbi:MAG TPA: hypothetical protein V6D20_23515 [Candidatus Obscuribacterales bacterium]